MDDAVRAKAFGKINLALSITGRREDGFHTLCSVMQSISLHDTVTAARKGEPGVALTSDDASLPCGEQNTAYRAAAVFLQAVSPGCGVSLHIQKAIPYEAGLGSASADPPRALAALNALFDYPLTLPRCTGSRCRSGPTCPFA
jgi:4-diphosphocytidyl-2-C-methyl-D-erythritol kinase